MFKLQKERNDNMRKWAMFLAIVFFIGVLPCYTTAADSGVDYYYYCDFENYDAPFGSGVVPDHNWKWRTNKNFGSFIDPETGSKCLRLNPEATVDLFFGQLINSGTLHISFYVKFTGDTKYITTRMYDGTDTGDANTIVSNTAYSKTININREGPKEDGTTLLQYYTSMQGWTLQPTDIKYTHREWHRFDLVFSSLGTGSANAVYYVDGKQVNATPVPCSTVKGFKTFSVFSGNNLSGIVGDDFCLVDNVEVRHWIGETGLRMLIDQDKRVAFHNGELDVRLSEPVDVSLITKENISITNQATGEQIKEFSISDIRQDRFKIRFDEELFPGGRYSVVFVQTVVGSIFKKPMLSAVEFRTQHKTTVRDVNIVDIDFNDYETDDATKRLPNGFVNLEKAEYIPSAVEGKDGNSDVAFGFVNAPQSSRQTRFLYELDGISGGTPYTVSFDVYSNNADWYLYLLEEGDFDIGKTGYDKNVAIAFTSSTGEIKYAEGRSSDASETVSDELVVASGQWHTINLYVDPKNDGTTDYTVSVDGGKPYTVNVARSFMTNVTKGFGVGYMARAERSDIYFDNIKITVKMEVIYPEADSVTMYYADGTVAVGNTVSSIINKIVIGFNTLVEQSTAEKYVALYNKNGTRYHCQYSLDNSNNVSVLTLEFPQLLEPDENWVLSVAPGIKSYFSDSVESELSFELRFSTRNDAGIRVFGQQFDGSVYNISFIKNNNDTAQYIIAVCGYNKVTRSIKQNDKEVLELDHVVYQLVEFDGDDRGVYHYSLPVDFKDDYSQTDKYLKTYLWKYPDLTKVNILTDGTIKN